MWKLKEKEIKEKSEQRVVELMTLKQWICGSPTRMVFQRLAINYAERRKEKMIREIHGGGTSKQKKR